MANGSMSSPITYHSRSPLSARARYDQPIHEDGRGRNLALQFRQERADGTITYGNETSSGVVICEDDVLTIDTILACVRVLGESMAALPFNLIRQENDNRENATDLPLYDLMRNAPNDETTAYEMRLWMMFDACVRGRGFAQVLRNASGTIISLWPLEARRMRKRREKATQRLVYVYMPAGSSVKASDDKGILLEADEVLEIQVLPGGGLLGQSIVSLQRECIGAAKAAEMYSSEFFANGGAVTGTLEVPKEMSEQAYLRLKKDWKAAHTARGKRHSVPILEGGAKFTALALNHEETQLLETRKFQRSSIAGLFRVPAHLINDMEKATFSNIEQQDLGFVKHALRPWMTNWEQRCNLTLLSKIDRLTLGFKHNDRDLLRGDFPSRMDGYGKGINAGVFSPNDCRRLEDLNPYPGGDVYLVNSTLVPIKNAGKVPPSPQPAPTK